MAVGDLTVTVVGTYTTVALAVAAMDAGNDPTPATDSHQLIVLPGIGGSNFVVLKTVKATV